MGPSGIVADDMDETTKHFVPHEKKANLPDDVIEAVEKEFKVVTFWDDGASTSGIEDSTRLVICGEKEDQREAAVAKIKELQEVEAKWEKKKDDWGDDKKWDDKKDDKKWDDKKDDKKDEDKWWEK